MEMERKKQESYKKRRSVQTNLTMLSNCDGLDWSFHVNGSISGILWEYFGKCRSSGSRRGQALRHGYGFGANSIFFTLFPSSFRQTDSLLKSICFQSLHNSILVCVNPQSNETFHLVITFNQLTRSIHQSRILKLSSVWLNSFFLHCSNATWAGFVLLHQSWPNLHQSLHNHLLRNSVLIHHQAYYYFRASYRNRRFSHQSAANQQSESASAMIEPS